MIRFQQSMPIVSTLLLSLLLMQIVHKSGHILGTRHNWVRLQVVANHGAEEFEACLERINCQRYDLLCRSFLTSNDRIHQSFCLSQNRDSGFHVN